MQKACALSQVLGNVTEHTKELSFFRDQSHPAVELLVGIFCSKIASTISSLPSERQISTAIADCCADFYWEINRLSQLRFKAGFNFTPFCIKNAEVNRVALTAIMGEHMFAQRAFLFSAKAKDRLPGTLIEGVRLEFHAKAFPDFESVAKHQVLCLRVYHRSLPRRRDPGRTDFNFAIGQVHVHKTSSAHDRVRGSLDSCEWHSESASLFVEYLAVEFLEIFKRLQPIGNPLK